MHGGFCPIRLIHLIGRKSLHFEKTILLDPEVASGCIFNPKSTSFIFMFGFENKMPKIVFCCFLLTCW